MHPALERAQQAIEIRRTFRPTHGYVPVNLKHDKLVTLRVFVGSNKTKRFEFLLKVCPACMSGYVFDYSSEEHEDIKPITQAQWKGQIKPYTTICSAKEN